MSVSDALSSSHQNRTNVRPTTKPSVRVGALRLLARVSPALAGRIAGQLFLRTFRPPVRPDDQLALDAGRRFAVGFGRARLAAWSFGDETGRPTVVLSHGWCGRAAQLAPLAVALAEAGFRAVVFDHPGHGESPGTSTTIPEMAHALAEVDAAVGGAHVLVAHSMGAVVATVAMARTITPRRAVFIAPPAAADGWLAAFARGRLGLGPGVDASMRRAVEARAGVALATLDPLVLARQREQPLLVVHDRGDREVPFAAGQAIASAWPEAQLVATDALGHYRILRSPEVHATVGAFLAPLLSADLRLAR